MIVRLLMICMVGLLVVPAWSQVTVTTAPGEDEDSRQRDADGSVRNDAGQYYSAETDGEYESLSTAISDLQQFGSGGTIIINNPSPDTPLFALQALTNPFTIRGTEGANLVSIELGVINTTLTLENLRIGNGDSSGSAVRMNNSEVTVTNCVFNRHGVTVDEGQKSIVTITDSEFIDPFPNGLTGFGNELDVTVKNTTFRDTTTFAKGLAILPALGVATVDVSDCTFENFYMGIDDRRRTGNATYHNIYMNNIFWVGLNLEWTDTANPFEDATTRVTRSVFENCAFQGIHYHGPSNITVLECRATGCGTTDAWEDDGAGIGGHFGGSNIIYQDCISQDNEGHGFFFDDTATGITIKRSLAQNNGRSGMHFQHVSNVRVDERNLLSGNERSGLVLKEVSNYTIQQNNIGVNQFSIAAQANEEHGIHIIDSGPGLIGTTEADDKGNLISGNVDNGVYIDSFTSGEVTIGGNWIGTNRQGTEAIPNLNGISLRLNQNSSGTLRIGGENPAIAQQTSGALGGGNLISGNLGNGINLGTWESITDTNKAIIKIEGNLIGIDGTGTVALPNSSGIVSTEIHNASLTIGAENQASRRNIISANRGEGISLASTNKALIHSNAIGLGIDFMTDLGNFSNGIDVQSRSTQTHIENNWIYYNQLNGILIIGEGTDRNTITKNSIHANTFQGILITDGANGGIKPPILDHRFRPGESSEDLEGFTDVTNPTIEVFEDPVLGADQKGYWGQGKEYLHSPSLLGDSQTFTTFLNPTNNGFYTATVTDENGNTSEFSPIASARVIQTVHPDSDEFRDEDPLLVANKKTVVRVYTHTGAGNTQATVSGELKVEQTGATVAAMPKTHAMTPFGFYHGNDKLRERYMAQDTLNFYMDNGASGLVDLTLKLTDGTHERAEIDLGEYDFQTGLDPMNLLCILLPAPPSTFGTGVPPNQGKVTQAAQYLMSVYPIDPVVYMNNLSFVSFPPNSAAMGTNGPPHSFGARTALVANYELFRAGYRYSILGTPPQYCAVFVSSRVGLSERGASDTIYGYSLPNAPGRTVLLVDGRRRNHAGSTLAHEIGHVSPFSMGDTYDDPSLEKDVNPLNPAGVRHNRFGNIVPEEEFGFDPTGNANLEAQIGRRGRPAGPGVAFSVNEFMGSSDTAWVDARTNRHLFRALGSTKVPAAKVQPQQEPSSTLTFSGMVSLTGESLLQAVREDFIPFVSTPPTIDTGFSIQLLDQAGAVLSQSAIPVSFFGEVLGQNESSGDPFGRLSEGDESPFVVTMENHPDVHEVAIRQGDTLLVSSRRTSAAPQVAITIPDFPDGVATGEVEVSWDVDDSDSEPDNCFIDLFFAHTDGDIRIPLLMNARNQDTLTVDMATMPGGEECRFEIVVNDGWNQTEAASEAFMTLDCIPSVAITSPDPEEPTVFSDTPIALQGSAYDPEDRMLGGENLTWYLDDSEEVFATGFNPTVMIPEGSHTLTLVAVDAAGNEASTSLDIKASPLDDETFLRMWELHTN